MEPTIAITGMACRYPDANSPEELWRNVLAQRPAFRRMPPERLRLEDYYSRDPHRGDSLYVTEAAVIEGFEFDRVRFRVAGSKYRSADITHWLALDTADRALADAGFADGRGLPRGATGVFIGNTLTGEFSRANILRLRWPYVRRHLEEALRREGWAPERSAGFLAQFEEDFKKPFPAVNEETLAGSLSNTIAGRISNHYDLKGGGYTLDGACASSLLAAQAACAALASGDVEVALAGGVDLSLDPFELVGFARAGALAKDSMRVYDARSEGFWPGEGCGLVVLMRLDEAVAQGRRVYATIRGWGVSSDGSGGITRPEVEGQMLALRRAYQRAGFGPETVAYFEGHGTGTSVGDATELSALTRAVGEAGARAHGHGAPAVPAVIGSVKALIGHTKAAAGVAGLIKAAMAVHRQALPPTAGCEEPHPQLGGERPVLRVLREAEPWPQGRALRAGVSAMGFGGINVHLALEGVSAVRRSSLSEEERALSSTPQGAELMLLSAADAAALRAEVKRLRGFARRLSRAEVTDLAAALQQRLDGGQVRAALVAETPADLAEKLAKLCAWLDEGVGHRLDIDGGLFLGGTARAPRVGFLFTGQGVRVGLGGGAWRRRFTAVHELYGRANLPPEWDGVSTEVAQPAIVAASLAGLGALRRFGVEAEVAVGHSLGELTALHWAGAMSEETLWRTAAARGRLMSRACECEGAMASVAADAGTVARLLEGGVVVAAHNGPRRTVISGEASAVKEAIARAESKGLGCLRLPVSNAFHSPLMSGALAGLAEHLSLEQLAPPRARVVSTVTGDTLAEDEDLRALLGRQLTAPVLFEEAARRAFGGCDLLVEVGPGHMLTGLVQEVVAAPCVAVEAGGESLRGLWLAVGAAFALGADVRHEELFAGRFSKPFDLDWKPRFFVNPCELAPVPDEDAAGVRSTHEPSEVVALPPVELQAEALAAGNEGGADGDGSPLEAIRRLVAERAELPIEVVGEDQRLLADLHLNSITVSQIVSEAARRLGLAPPASPSDYSTVTVGEAARSLAELPRLVEGEQASRQVPGVAPWVRSFTVEFVEEPLPARAARARRGAWQFFAPEGHQLAAALRREFEAWGEGDGVVVCLPLAAGEREIPLLLSASAAALAKGEGSHFVLVQYEGGGAASFARSLYMEAPGITTTVVGVPWGRPGAAAWVVEEVRAAAGFTEALYDAQGRRHEPRLRLRSFLDGEVATPLDAEDVLLVTGGGKGIAAECALQLARETGLRLVLLGRSRPEDDSELAANLERFNGAGLSFLYLPCDVSDGRAVESAFAAAREAFGEVTAIIHGAGTNTPRRLGSLGEEDVLRTMSAKVRGAAHLLAAADAESLRLFVTFGSLIARTGMEGEADYALANEWLVHLTERWREGHPHCRCLAVEWSVWAGAGMGQRLGALDALARQGITPIPVDEGVRVLKLLLSRELPSVHVLITSRFGEPPTLRPERAELPFYRFLELPRVHCPGVELIADSELSPDSDPYLDEHLFEGARLFPAVLGLEAMAQAAMALAGSDRPPVFEDVEFARPVAVGAGGGTRIRVAALAHAPGTVEVVLRCAETSFQLDHFRAVCRFTAARPGARAFGPIGNAARVEAHAREETAPPVPLEPARDLYGGLLFQGGRFQRVRGYRRLAARACVAEVERGVAHAWFGRYLPQTLVLGDPGARDAFMHAIQPCVPDATILPAAVERIAPVVGGASRVLVAANERSRDANVYVYDVEATGEPGEPREVWTGLRLVAVAGPAMRDGWVGPLLGTHLERLLLSVSPHETVCVAVECDEAAGRRARGERTMRRALGRDLPVPRRPDGRPDAGDGRAVSVTHCGGLTMAVAGACQLSCDAEKVVERDARAWADLLGAEGAALADLVAREAGEDTDAAATRVWAAVECLKKAGALFGSSPTFGQAREDGTVILNCGALAIVTRVVRLRGERLRVALAVALGGAREVVARPSPARRRAS